MSSETPAPTIPAPPPEGAPPRGRGGLRWLAIAIGAGVDVAGTRVSSTLLTVAIGVALNVGGSGKADEAANHMSAILQSPWLSALSITMGLLWSVAGGYLTGYLAKRRQVLNAALTGVCAAGFGLASQALSGVLTVTPWLLALAATTVPAAMLGGWLSSLGLRSHTGTLDRQS